MNSISGRWRLGFLLTVLSILLWGGQPVAIAMIRTIPYSTLAFYKILSAAILVAAYLAACGRFPSVKALSARALIFLAAGAAGLSVSYVCFNTSFKFISPSNVQVYFQTSRIFLALAGIFLFKETFRPPQWLGLGAVILGLILFFHSQLAAAQNGEGYFLGITLALASAATWALFAVVQKYLLVQMSSLQILAAIYFGSVIFLLPYADTAPLLQLGAPEWIALGFICLSNVLAFACFSESLNHWESSKIATVSCLTPLMTMVLMYFASHTFLQAVQPDNLGLIDLAGALLSIAGSILVVATRKS